MSDHPIPPQSGSVVRDEEDILGMREDVYALSRQMSKVRDDINKLQTKFNKLYEDQLNTIGIVRRIESDVNIRLSKCEDEFNKVREQARIPTGTDPNPNKPRKYTPAELANTLSSCLDAGLKNMNRNEAHNLILQMLIAYRNEDIGIVLMPSGNEYLTEGVIE